MTLTVGSLFSGIGGLDLGLERAGHKVIWQSEIDPYACKVLKKHWPEVPNHGDIKQIDWRAVEPVDIICGGYPCQPFSTAGKRRGADDPRHLWRWVREAISELRPRYAILENVRGHLSLGGVQVLGELAEIGYDAEWRVVSAAGVGAPHRRDRIIIVAYPSQQFSDGRRLGFGARTIEQWEEIQITTGRSGGTLADSNGDYSSDGRQCEDVQSKDQSWRNDGSGSGSDFGQIGMGSARETSSNVGNSTSSSRRVTQSHDLRPRIWQASKLGESNSAARSIGDWWEVEPSVGRVAHGIPNRVDRLRGLGNAVVPQVAEYIGRLITTSLDT